MVVQLGELGSRRFVVSIGLVGPQLGHVLVAYRHLPVGPHAHACRTRSCPSQAQPVEDTTPLRVVGVRKVHLEVTATEPAAAQDPPRDSAPSTATRLKSVSLQVTGYGADGPVESESRSGLQRETCLGGSQHIAIAGDAQAQASGTNSSRIVIHSAAPSVENSTPAFFKASMSSPATASACASSTIRTGRSILAVRDGNTSTTSPSSASSTRSAILALPVCGHWKQPPHELRRSSTRRPIRARPPSLRYVHTRCSSRRRCTRGSHRRPIGFEGARNAAGHRPAASRIRRHDSATASVLSTAVHRPRSRANLMRAAGRSGARAGPAAGSSTKLTSVNAVLDDRDAQRAAPAAGPIFRMPTDAVM